jgi:carboxyl-terminal processing protease
MEDTPGFRAGLLSGDKMSKSTAKARKAWTCRKPSKLSRHSRHQGDHQNPPSETQEFKEHELTRAEINVPSVKDDAMLEEGIGYIRVLQFKEPTANDLQTALDNCWPKACRA